ncbi:MAG: hypothetical protein ACK5OW_00595 [bacterium]|jgi:hypothetical protein
MKGKTQAIDFIEYISKPMNKEDISLMYKINNITPERTGLYLDFTQTIYQTIISTYLGDEVMDNKSIKEHFDWCWNKTVNSFKKEEIFFDSNELYNYFYTLFLESFYSENDKSDLNVNKLLEFWLDIFNFSKTKTRSELEAFIDLYKLFDKSLLN